MSHSRNFYGLCDALHASKPFMLLILQQFHNYCLQLFIDLDRNVCCNYCGTSFILGCTCWIVEDRTFKEQCGVHLDIWHVKAKFMKFQIVKSKDV